MTLAHWVSKLKELLAQQESLLVLEYRTELFSSPFIAVWALLHHVSPCILVAVLAWKGGLQCLQAVAYWYASTPSWKTGTATHHGKNWTWRGIVWDGRKSSIVMYKFVSALFAT